MPVAEIRGSHLSARVSVSVSQDTVGNRSTLRIIGLEVRNEWGEIGSAYVTGTISINGSRAASLSFGSAYGCGVVFAKDSWCGVGLGSGADLFSVTVSHSSDGTHAPVSVSVSLSARNASGSQSYGSVGGSGAVSLPDIPRVTGIDASGVTLGSVMSITLSRASASFRDTVSWRCGSESGVVAEKTGSETLAWTPPVELSAENTQGTAVDVILTVTTYSGSAVIGSKSVTARCAIPDSVVPTLKFAVTDNTGCFTKYGCFVRTRSQARVKTTAAGALGSTVKSIAVSCGSLTGSGAEAVFSLPDPGTVAVRVTVTDSRGRRASASRTAAVADYQNPSVSVTALYRCGADGTPDPQGGYGKAVFAGAVTSLGGKNSAVYRLKKRVRGTDAWEEREISEYTGQFAPHGEVIFPAGVDDDFEVCVSVSDDFTQAAGQVTVLPVAFSLLDFHRESKSVGILQRASTDGAVDIGGDTVHHGHRLRDVGAPKDPGDAVTLGALLDAVYPVGAVYISFNETSLALRLGGTWERIKDRFLLAAGDTYASGETGGETAHTLTVDELPSHTHELSTRFQSDAGSWYPIPPMSANSGTEDKRIEAIGHTGGSQPHNNMPPYIAVYMWKRTA